MKWGLGAMLLGSAFLLTGSQERGARLDASGAFYHPWFAVGENGDPALAKLNGGDLHASTYLRYLAARAGPGALEEMAFDVALARECAARGLMRSAPVLARSLATQRLHAAPARKGEDRGQRLLRLRNEALRELRVDALVQADRVVDEAEVKAFFERQYGVGGRAVRVRQVLVSFSATRRRLRAAGRSMGEEAVAEAAGARAEGLHARVTAGARLGDLLRESDDRAALRMLRDPDLAPQAGVVSGYDQQRYGDVFAAAVRDLPVGKVSAPVRSRLGFHLIEVLGRGATRYEDVAAVLRRQIRGGAATPNELAALRVALLRKYAFAETGR